MRIDLRSLILSGKLNKYVRWRVVEHRVRFCILAFREIKNLRLDLTPRFIQWNPAKKLENIFSLLQKGRKKY
jgi:hypothetical protein